MESPAHNDRHFASRGFTLVELAIVLIVVGLIAGGVLAGKSLIGAARIQAQVTQIRQVNAAVLAFDLRYNCLPGDCMNPSYFGLPQASLYQQEFGQAGNGNKLLDFSGFQCTAGNGMCEEVFLWAELKDAGLISSDFSYATPGSLSNNAGAWFVYGNNMPRARINSGKLVGCTANGTASQTGTLLSVTHFAGRHYLRLIRTSRTTSADCSGATSFDTCLNTLGGEGTWCESLTSQQALAIDRKIDDGLPMTGNTLAAQGYSFNDVGNPLNLNNPTVGANGDAVCVQNSTVPSQYNVSNDAPSRCALNIRADF